MATDVSELVSELCTGCATADYFSAETTLPGSPVKGEKMRQRIRIANVRDEGPQMEDPTGAMLKGVHVLFFNPKTRVFEPRTVRVDDKFIFLHVLSTEQGQPQGSSPPIIVRMKSVVAAHDREEALHLCKSVDIFERGLDASSAVVVQAAPISKYEDTPGLDKLLVFMCAGHLHLKACIESCMAKATPFNLLALEKRPAAESIDKTSLALGSPEHVDEKPKEVGKQVKRRIERMRIANSDSVLNTHQQKLQLQVQFRPQSETLSVHDDVTMNIHARMLPTDARLEVARLMRAQDVQLCALDKARLELVMQECFCLRQWATPLATPDLFGQGVHNYLSDSSVLESTILQDDAFRAAARAVKNEIEGGSHMQADPDDASDSADSGLCVAELSVRSATLALAELLELEKEFATVAHQAVQHGMLETSPPVCSLACQKIASESESSAKSTPRLSPRGPVGSSPRMGSSPRGHVGSSPRVAESPRAPPLSERTSSRATPMVSARMPLETVRETTELTEPNSEAPKTVASTEATAATVSAPAPAAEKPHAASAESWLACTPGRRDGSTPHTLVGMPCLSARARGH